MLLNYKCLHSLFIVVEVTKQTVRIEPYKYFRALRLSFSNFHTFKIKTYLKYLTYHFLELRYLEFSRIWVILGYLGSFGILHTNMVLRNDFGLNDLFVSKPDPSNMARNVDNTCTYKSTCLIFSCAHFSFQSLLSSNY